MRVAPSMVAGIVGLAADLTLKKGPNGDCHVEGQIASNCKDSVRVGTIKDDQCVFDDLGKLKFLSMCKKSTALGFGVTKVDNKYALRFVADEYIDLCYFPALDIGTRCNLDVGTDNDVTVSSVDIKMPTQSAPDISAPVMSQLITDPAFRSEFSVASTTSPARSTEPTTSYPCTYKGGPHVATPSCECITELNGQTYSATADPSSGQCDQYSTFPSSITPRPTSSATTTSQAESLPTPYVETVSGEILSWPAQSIQYGQVPGGHQVNHTVGVGTPVTLLPQETEWTGSHGLNIGCHGGGLGDECDGAADDFLIKGFDKKTLTGKTARWRVAKNMPGVIKGKCRVSYECDDDKDYGNLTGQMIYDMYWRAKKEHNVKSCSLSLFKGKEGGKCELKVNYCMSDCPAWNDKLDEK